MPRRLNGPQTREEVAFHLLLQTVPPAHEELQDLCPEDDDDDNDNFLPLFPPSSPDDSEC
jgi:hypothetical protein